MIRVNQNEQSSFSKGSQDQFRKKRTFWSQTKINLLLILNFVIVAILACQFYQSKTKKQEVILTASVNIPIVYVWLGTELPSKYENRLNWITYPYKFLTDKDWQKYEQKYKQYNLTVIQKADILRLQYLLQNGGIYSDFDVIIDYQCLMNILYPLYSLHLIPCHDWTYTNAFIYVDKKNDKSLAKLLEMTIKQVKQDKQPRVRTGPWLYKTYDFLQAIPNSQKCMLHMYDETWNKDSRLKN